MIATRDRMMNQQATLVSLNDFFEKRNSEEAMQEFDAYNHFKNVFEHIQQEGYYDSILTTLKRVFEQEVSYIIRGNFNRL